MSRTTPLLALLLLPASGLAAAGTPPHTEPVRDVAGIISVEAEAFADAHGWEVSPYYTGVSLRALQPEDAKPAAVYPVQVDHPGVFTVHLLGNRRPGAPTGDCLPGIAVAPAGGDPGPVVQLRFQDLNAPAWTAQAANGNEPPTIEFPARGRYQLQLSAERGFGFLVDKIVLSSSGFVPSGVGPDETRGPAATPHVEGPDPMVVLPPRWAFGVLYGGYTDQSRSVEVVDRLIAGDFPIDAYWIDSWFWDFVNAGRGPGGYLRFEEDKAAFPDVAAMWRHFEQRHVKAGIWTWDCILREGNEATFDEFNRAGALSPAFIERNGWHNSTRLTISANIEFEKPATIALWREKMQPFFEKGLDFLKLDRSSAIPFCRAAFEATQQLGRETQGRGFILAHLHSTHDKRHKLYPTKWSGDAKIAWTQPDYPDLSRYAMGGLRENIAMVADPARTTYEIPFLTHDAGGYDTFGSGEPGEELWVRWIQFAALNTVMTVFSQQTSPTGNLPFNYSAAAQDVYRKYTHLRLRLFPYLYTLALEARLTGTKPVRGDREHDDQYRLGEDLLVAPVHVRGATAREVAFPAGRWFDWDDGRAWEGGRSATVPAPLEKLPLFARAGAIVPLRDYARSIEQGNNHHLTLEVFPSATPSIFTLREDDGVSNEYLDGAIASTKLSLHPSARDLALEIGPVQGAFRGMPPERRWTVRFHGFDTPAAVRLNGRTVDSSFDAARRVLQVSFSARAEQAAVLTVSRAP